MQQQQGHAPLQTCPEASAKGQHGQHAPQDAEPDRPIDVLADEGRAAGLFDKRRHHQHDKQGYIGNQKETLHQNGANWSFFWAFTAMHSISTSQPGRQTAACTKTFGVWGKRASYMAFTTS